MATGLLGCFLYTLDPVSKSLSRGNAAGYPRLPWNPERQKEAGCPAGPLLQVYIGHVNMQQRCALVGVAVPWPASAPAPTIPHWEAVGLTDPQCPNFFNCKCYFLSREKCIYFKWNLLYLLTA